MTKYIFTFDHEPIERLSESEQQRMLRIVDEIALRPPTRPEHEVEAELIKIHRDRRRCGRCIGKTSRTSPAFS